MFTRKCIPPKIYEQYGFNFLNLAITTTTSTTTTTAGPFTVPLPSGEFLLTNHSATTIW
jgi:hypothetical protein